MKIIKSLLLVSFGLTASFALHAQQQEEKTAKALPAQLTKAAVADTKSTVTPVVIEMTAADAKVAAPSPLTKDDNTKIPEKENIKFITVDGKATSNQLTPEQIKTLNGATTLPKQSAIAPGTENIKPLPVLKPVLVKEQ